MSHHGDAPHSQAMRADGRGQLSALECQEKETCVAGWLEAGEGHNVCQALSQG